MDETKHFYLEPGFLITEGTLLKVWDEDEQFGGLYEVTVAQRTPSGGWADVKALVKPDHRSPDESFTKGDLDDLLWKKQLKVYNV
jgi:hypothetical protein